MEYKDRKYNESYEVHDLETAIRFRTERNELENVLILADQIDEWEDCY